jgi:hypothetical protein
MLPCHLNGLAPIVSQGDELGRPADQSQPDFTVQGVHLFILDLSFYSIDRRDGRGIVRCCGIGTVIKNEGPVAKPGPSRSGKTKIS